MLLLLILLLRWRVTTCISSPTLEDNKIPTDEEVITDLINSYRGQPEQEIALNLPTDEEAFNEIKPFLQAGNPLYYINGGGHFIASSFPEIDSRGFHESVFDDLDDFYPISQRGKKYDSIPVSARGFYGDVFTDGFGTFHPVKRYYKNDDFRSYPSRSYNRQKRSLLNLKENPTLQKSLPRSQSSNQKSNKSENSSYLRRCSNQFTYVNDNDTSQKRSNFHADNTASSTSATSQIKIQRNKRNSINHNPLFASFRQTADKRRPEVDSTGFHNDAFGTFEEFDTLRKRVPEIGKTGFHSDLFHDQFDKFDTLKRSPDMGVSGFHGDVFHKSFGNFETLRKRSPALDSQGINGDAFNRDFGHFATLRKRKPNSYFNDDTLEDDFTPFFSAKRRPRFNGFNSDAFYSNFGDWETLRKRALVSNKSAIKRRPSAAILHGDAFHNNFGNFDTMKRTLAGDAFHSNFGNFDTMKRTLAGDAFHSNFGNFDTMKRTLGGDAFHSNFGSFDTMKRTLGGDAFHSNFGQFEPMKRTLGGDAFHSQFGQFETMKRGPEMDAAGFKDDMLYPQFNIFKRTSNSKDGYDLYNGRIAELDTPQNSKLSRTWERIRSYPTFGIGIPTEYDRFKDFIRSRTLTNNFDELQSKSRVNQTTMADIKRTNSSTFE